MKRRLRSAKQGIREISREYVENAMIQADMMRNKPHMPNAFNSLKSDLSPHYKNKKPVVKKFQNKDHTARAALMIAKANVNSMMLQQESEKLLNIRTRSVKSPTDVECSKRSFVISSPRSTLKSKRQSVKFNLN